MNMRETVQENPLLAIMRNVPLERTEDYVGAVIRGGVRFFEMAMNTPHALEQIRLIRNSFGKKILVGGGKRGAGDVSRLCEASERAF